MTRLIDADALIDHLKNDPLFDLVEQYGLTRVIEAEITIDAEPVRHGKYIGTEFDGYADGCPVYYEWKCSECGCVFEEEEPTYNYCPFCGAKMDGGRKEEFDCNDCYYSMQNCNDRSICCEDETALCDYFEPVAERKQG